MLSEKPDNMREVPPEIKAVLDSALRKKTSPQQVQADIGSLWAPQKYLRMGATRILSEEKPWPMKKMKVFAAGCGVSDRGCAESSDAGWSSLQETAEHSGKGKNILYHFTDKLQE